MPSVQRVRWAEFRVVVTAAAGLSILAVLVYLLTGGTVFQPEAVLYVYVPDATGLAKGSPVRVDGIQVGKVDSVTLSGSVEPNRVVKVTMIVDRIRLSTITVDSTAQSAADTLVGDKFIQISTGQSTQRVRPGAEIPYQGSPDLVKSLDLSQFRQSLQQMDSMLTDIETGRNQFGQLIMTDDLYRDVIHRVGELERGLRAAASTTSEVGRELYTDALYQRIAEPIVRLDESLARLQSGQGSAGQFLHENAQYEQSREQIGTLRKSIGDVRRSALITSSASYDEWSRNVAGWIRTVDDFNQSPAVATSIDYDNLAGMAKELQGTLQEFRRNPGKYLRLKLF